MSGPGLFTILTPSKLSVTNTEGLEPTTPIIRMRKPMKRFSFAEAYGLGLIAKNPKDDWSDIRGHLSVEAQQIAQVLISPSSPASRRAPREVKSAADELRTLAQKVDNSTLL